MFIPVGVLAQRTVLGTQTVCGDNSASGGVVLVFASHGGRKDFVAVFVKRGRVAIKVMWPFLSVCSSWPLRPGTLSIHSRRALVLHVCPLYPAVSCSMSASLRTTRKYDWSGR